jgi:RNA 2',3'-cyclic 3'-phosphodiesterase
LRLFVAANLPPIELQRIAAILEDLERTPLPVRWVKPDSIHITLKFLGEVADTRVADVVAAIHRAAANTDLFDVAIGGFGVFPSRTRPRVFWIGVAESQALHAVQHRVEEQLQPLGFPREARAFSPHITLGRLKPNARVEGAEWDRIAAGLVYNGVFNVQSIDLMRSHLSPRGARYERIAAAKLNGGDNGLSN